MKISTLKAKSILVKSNLPASDYVANPYGGCTHQCRYCYACFMKRFTGHDEDWGTFLDVKEYESDKLPKSLTGKTILLSSVTDPYNPFEAKYHKSREVLERLRGTDAHIEILSKSDLMVRDLDLLRQIPDLSVGISLNTLDDGFRKDMEPGAPSVQRRLKALETLHDVGITTYLFVSPIFPYITDIRALIEAVNGHVDQICFENLNLRGAAKGEILDYIAEKYPQHLDGYKAIYRKGDLSYWEQLDNPLIASSCIATESVANVLRLAVNGVQGAILKSCADYDRGKVSGKREFAVDKELGYTYASAPFESEILTLDECQAMMQELRPQTETLLIPSFTAACLAPNDWIPACQQLEAAGADGIQLDFFYMGNLIGTDGLSGRIVSLLRELNTALRIPVMPKLNINLPKDYIMPLLVEGGVKYVSLLDSVRSPYLRKTDGAYRISERLDVETTSCFGHWQLPLTLGYTYTAAKYGLMVCAGGGITCAEDVQKLLAAGATTVQSATFLTKFPAQGCDLFT